MTRLRLAEQIRQKSVAWAIGQVEHEQIDELNILNASMLAMQKAVQALGVAPHHVQVDGNRCPELNCSVEAIVKGDAILGAIGAASILAKVTRDKIMIEMDERYPGYGFAKHKGYPTRQHNDALALLCKCQCWHSSFGSVSCQWLDTQQTIHKRVF